MAKRKLTKRQKEQIAAIQERRKQKAEARAENAIADVDLEAGQRGTVITRHGQNLAIADEQGHLIHCLSRQNIGHLVCGDVVIWQPTTEGHGVVIALVDRQSALIRPNYSGEEKPLAANITQLVIVLAAEPPPSDYLLDQYLVTAENIGVNALIAMNKRDLLQGALRDAFESRFAHYQEIGYPIVEISAKFNDGLSPLFDKLQHETSILVGQSGVGKSSLINALLPDRNIQIGRLSEASGLGKHTTSATTLYSLPEGGRLIDSPGVRSFRLVQLTTELLENGFKEFRPFLGRCRFSNCSHRSEPGYALTEAVKQSKIHPKRLQNQLHMAKSNAKD